MEKQYPRSFCTGSDERAPSSTLNADTFCSRNAAIAGSEAVVGVPGSASKSVGTLAGTEAYAYMPTSLGLGWSDRPSVSVDARAFANVPLAPEKKTATYSSTSPSAASSPSTSKNVVYTAENGGISSSVPALTSWNVNSVVGTVGCEPSAQKPVKSETVEPDGQLDGRTPYPKHAMPDSEYSA
eukprot:2368385-Prymnesium_polylepis.1